MGAEGGFAALGAVPVLAHQAGAEGGALGGGKRLNGLLDGEEAGGLICGVRREARGVRGGGSGAPMAGELGLAAVDVAIYALALVAALESDEAELMQIGGAWAEREKAEASALGDLAGRAGAVG